MVRSFFGEKCYLFSIDRQDWRTSQSPSMSVSSHRVVVKSEAEQAYPWEKAEAWSQGDSYWRGLLDSTHEGLTAYSKSGHLRRFHKGEMLQFHHRITT
ncbi:hypothetical protein ANANG_G00182650 [Anguilla anguilla]|uniref:Uncharacterized protein n=1 Tax=Anguilla anguilla TaxID=7936 RepID=A0A9D3M5K7_ANGAN|nr:hypothetical protein ANANG_G00182650 [Anguilla anguilla]